jgi:hypothetical protein
MMSAQSNVDDAARPGVYAPLFAIKGYTITGRGCPLMTRWRHGRVLAEREKRTLQLN